MFGSLPLKGEVGGGLRYATIHAGINEEHAKEEDDCHIEIGGAKPEEIVEPDVDDHRCSEHQYAQQTEDQQLLGCFLSIAGKPFVDFGYPEHIQRKGNGSHRQQHHHSTGDKVDIGVLQIAWQQAFCLVQDDDGYCQYDWRIECYQ